MKFLISKFLDHRNKNSSSSQSQLISTRDYEPIDWSHPCLIHCRGGFFGGQISSQVIHLKSNRWDQTNKLCLEAFFGVDKQGGRGNFLGGGRELKMTGCSNQEWNAKKILRLPLKKISSVTPSDTIPLSHAHTLTNSHILLFSFSLSHTLLYIFPLYISPTLSL